MLLRRLLLITISLLAVCMAKADNYEDYLTINYDWGTGKLIVEVKQSGGFNGHYSDYLAVNGWMSDNITNAKTVDFRGKPNADDFAKLTSTCTSAEMLLINSVTSALPGSFTVPSSVKCIIKKSDQSLPSGVSSGKTVMSLDGTTLTITGSPNGDYLDLTKMFSAGEIRRLDLSGATIADATKLKLPVQWGGNPPTIDIIVPSSTTSFEDYLSGDYANTIMTGQIICNNGTQQTIYAVNNIDASSVSTTATTLKLAVHNNNATMVMRAIGICSSTPANIEKIDLSSLQFPNGQNITITNNSLKQGVDIGTQPVYGNYTLSDNNSEFTSYSIASHITGNLDLSGCTHLTTLNLQGATIDGSISLPSSIASITVSSDEMKSKLISAGIDESKININSFVDGVNIVRGNYVIMNYTAGMTNFSDMLDEAYTLAGSDKRVVIHARGQVTGADITTWNTKVTSTGKSTYFDFYDMDVSTSEKMSSANTVLRTMMGMIKAGTIKKPYGMIIPRNLFDQASLERGENPTISADEIAEVCEEFGGRWRGQQDSQGAWHGVSFMYVNTVGSNSEEKKLNTNKFFNAGVDISLLHSDLRQSMSYIIGTDDESFVYIDDRIPAASRVSTVLINKNSDDTRDIKVILKGFTFLTPIMQGSKHLFDLNTIKNVTVVNQSGVEMTAEAVKDINELNDNLTKKVEGLNLYEAEWKTGSTVSTGNIKYLIVKKDVPIDASLRGSLELCAEISSENNEMSVVKTTSDGLVVKAMKMLDDKTADVKNLKIEGSVNNSDLKAIEQLSNLRLIDLSDATVAAGSSIANAKFEDNMAFNTNTAIILPTTPEPSVATIRTFQCAGNKFYTGQQTMGFYTNENGKKVLNVWTDEYHNTIGNMSPAIDSEMVLRFIPRYDNDSGTEYSFVNMNSGIFSQIASLNVPAIDFNMVNISSLGTDFSGLNANTHYITIPTAKANNSGTDYPNIENFTYGSNIWTVSTCKEPGENSWNYVNYCDRQYHNTTETTHLLYVTANGQGHVSGGADYYFSKHRNADRQIVLGNLNNADVASLTWMNSPKVDFSRAGISDVAMSGYNNANVKYIALPYTAAATPSLRDYDNETADDNCPSLEGIGRFDNNTDVKRLTYQSYKAGSALPVVDLFDRITSDNRIERLKYSGPINAMDLLAQGGYLDAKGHLQTQYNSTTVSVEQPDKSSIDITVSELTNTSANAVYTTGALNNKLSAVNGKVEVDLRDAYLPLEEPASPAKSYDYDEAGGKVSYQDDLCFSLLGFGTILKSIILPEHESVWRLPSSSFANGDNNSFTSICIPSNYKEIGSMAFANRNHLVHITTTKHDGDADGTIYDYNINGATKTCTLSSNLKKIETGAFYNVTKLTDVYVLASTAPVCEINSFSAASTHGWGGFNGTHPITRDSYINGSADQMFALLHFPVNIDMQQQANYTDLERVYTLEDELQTTDGDGNVIVWPTFTEQQRAYNQAVSGHTWNDWKSHYTEWTQDNNYNAVDPTDSPSSADIVDGTAYNKKEGVNDYEYTADYTGWHEFVLVARFNPTNDVPVYNFEAYKKNRWYTICVPFNMTKSMLLKAFGAKAGSKVNGETVYTDQYPIVRTLKSVIREDNASRKFITLYFTKDLASCGQTWNFKAAASDVKAGDYKGEYMSYKYYNSDVEPANAGNYYHDDFWGNQKKIDGIEENDPIVIYEGMPYIIKPILPEDDPSFTHRIEVLTKTMSKDSSYDSKIPFIKYSAPLYTAFTTNEDGDKIVDTSTLVTSSLGDDIPNYYMFVGSYKKVNVLKPRYSFFLAGDNRFYMHNEPLLTEAEWNANNYGFPTYEAYVKDYQTYYSWRNNECIIAPQAVITPSKGRSTADASTFNIGISVTPDVLLAGSASDNAQEVWMFDVDDTETGIENVMETRCEDEDKLSIYDLQGRKTEHPVAPGIYIINHKKVVLK